MSPHLEILVHVSGPSRGIDDARYREQARGFLDFKPSKRHNILNNSWTHGHIPQDGQRPSSQPDAAKRDSFAGPTQQLNTLRRRFHTRIQEATPGQAQHALQPLETPKTVNVFASPALPWTSIKETPHLLIERTPALQRPRTAPDAASRPAEVPKPLRRTYSDSWQTPPSVIPDSQPSQHSSQGHATSSPILKRPFQSSSPSPTRDSSLTTKRVRRHSPLQVNNGLDWQLISAPPSSLPLDSFSSSLSKDEEIQETGLPLEIHPLKPDISSAKFTSHLTPSLKTLAANLPLSKFFPAQCSLRAIDPLERGHWLISLSSWDDALKTKFWTFLTRFIGGGCAGWGVWCIRELVHQSTGDSSDKENEPPRAEEVVKVYCWGEVVREVWLGLYGGSEKRLRNMGTKWIDAGGDVVVAMP